MEVPEGDADTRIFIVGRHGSRKHVDKDLPDDPRAETGGDVGDTVAFDDPADMAAVHTMLFFYPFTARPFAEAEDMFEEVVFNTNLIIHGVFSGFNKISEGQKECTGIIVDLQIKLPLLKIT